MFKLTVVKSSLFCVRASVMLPQIVAYTVLSPRAARGPSGKAPCTQQPGGNIRKTRTKSTTTVYYC